MIKKILFLILPIVFLVPSQAMAADEVRDIAFPVNGPSSFRNDFGEPRGNDTRTHEGIDIPADKMTPIVSAVDGRVVYVVDPQEDWGYAISIQDSDGYTYRYLHINNDNIGTDDGRGGTENAYVSGIDRGARVTKGQHIAWVGDSGNAENTVSHLHFEIRGPNRTLINPYQSLVKAAQESKFSASIRIGSAPMVIHSGDGLPTDVDLEYYFAEDLSLGSRGEGVRQLQSRLKAMGYFTSYVTEYFGPITQAALIKYQNAKKIPASGILDLTTRNLLNEGLAPPPISSVTPDPFTQNLFVGSVGAQVTLLQNKLKLLGYFTVSPSGYFGPITKTAVIKFQIEKNITPTGIVEFITRGYLNGCLTYSGYSTLTGKSCSNLLLPGCTTHAGFSATTGQSCGTVLLPGCTSTTGYSTTTGSYCFNL